ncbi:MAG: cell division topological specificity factor MinE [Gammaproteobacteria bacterium]|nr:cell division topological specificity factor MinE [Gammaproteobacteria bacterium]
MGILKYFRKQEKSTAASAKERLQIVVAHERTRRNEADFLPQMRNEILAVITKYVEVDLDDISVSLDESGGNCSILELNVTLPSSEKVV